ncbi:MAG: phosphatase PAP2 family protein [Oscillospiraceae bacterium]|nr:phosphatase PAP2 family protein [Oscillospiraceae bacterium]
MLMKPFSLKNYRVEIILFYVLAAAAMAVAAVYDLKIDIALNDRSNVVANWFEVTGEMPLYLLVIAAFGVLTKCLKNKWLKGLCFVGTLGAGVYLGDFVARRLFADNAFRTVYGVVYGLGVSLLFLLALRFIPVPEKLVKPLILMSLLGVVGCAVSSGIINLAKDVWGRVRFRDLEEGYGAFTAWYVINGSNGAHSFPSGHTGSAGMTYFLMFLPFVSEKWQKRTTLLFAAAFVYTTTVAATRLIMGAHYLSDVAVGGTVAFTCVLVSLSVYRKLLPRFTRGNASPAPAVEAGEPE